MELGFKRCYDDKQCHVIVLTDGQEVAHPDPAKLQRLAERVVDGKFVVGEVRVLERLQ